MIRTDDPRTVTVDELNGVMEFDHVIRVHADGRVSEPRDLYAPEVYADQVVEGGWSLMNGYSGQQSYSGPHMHPSEYIGGGLARDILAEPGYYVAVMVHNLERECRACGRGITEGADGVLVDGDDNPVCESADDGKHEEQDDDVVGWAVAYRTWATDADRYRQEVATIVDGFEFELCAECGKDLDAHLIGPDPLGHAGTTCLTVATEPREVVSMPVHVV